MLHSLHRVPQRGCNQCNIRFAGAALTCCLAGISITAKWSGMHTFQLRRHRAPRYARFSQRTSRRYMNLCWFIPVTVVLAACHHDSCTRVWQSRLPSPDGDWVASVHQEVCKRGIVSDAQIGVALQPRGDTAGAKDILWPSGQWSKPSLVHLGWISDQELEVTVPNRSIVPDTIARYRGVAIRIVYRHDDPVDRTRWLDGVRRNRDWLDGKIKGSQPAPPPDPDSVADSIANLRIAP